jgi:hypothetical protein
MVWGLSRERVWVTVERVWIGDSIYWALNTHDSELEAITAPSQISTIHNSPQRPLSLSPTCCDFINLSLATASNSRDSSASRAQVLSSQPPVKNCLTTEFSTERIVKVKVMLLIAPVILVLTYWHGPHRKRRSSSVVCVFKCRGNFFT